MLTIMHAITNTISDKVKSLVSFLGQITKGFDSISEEIDHPNLKTALKAVAVESNQYAKELSIQLNEQNLENTNDSIWKEIVLNMNENASHNKGGEIEELCNNCEAYFEKFYNAILTEGVPTKNLKDIIVYQLYAMQCAFNKIRLLNKMRFSET
jgi:hypothetical protein